MPTGRKYTNTQTSTTIETKNPGTGAGGVVVVTRVVPGVTAVLRRSHRVWRTSFGNVRFGCWFFLIGLGVRVWVDRVV